MARKGRSLKKLDDANKEDQRLAEKRNFTLLLDGGGRGRKGKFFPVHEQKRGEGGFTDE